MPMLNWIGKEAVLNSLWLSRPVGGFVARGFNEEMISSKNTIKESKCLA